MFFQQAEFARACGANRVGVVELFSARGWGRSPPCLGGYVLLRFVVTLFEQFQHFHEKTNQVEREAWWWVKSGVGGGGGGGGE